MPDATYYAYNYAGKIDSSLTTSSIWKPLHTTLWNLHPCTSWTWSQQGIYKPTVAKYLVKELYIVIV